MSKKLTTYRQSNIFVPNSATCIMKSKLVVKNFGPIKEVSLDLRNVNVFIGPQATGKSALAKIFTIFKAPRKFFYKTDSDTNKKIIDNEKASKQFADVFSEYNISSFLNTQTEIEFESELHLITYKNGVLNYEPKLLDQINYLEILFVDFDKNKTEIATKFSEFSGKFLVFDIKASRLLYEKDLPTILDKNNYVSASENKSKEILEVIREIEEHLSTSTAIYIPAERNLVNIIKKAALNLMVNSVPIPKHILSFGAELEKITLNEIKLDFIQKELVYKIIDGEDKVYINADNIISLNEAASGIQSVVPLLASVLSEQTIYHRSFVIEEAELNLFPLAQYELIKLLEARRTDPRSRWEDYGTIHTYTTHSPYILSSLNNLLYAFKVRMKLFDKLNDSSDATPSKNMQEATERVQKIVKATINPENFTAYQICDGSARSIFNNETGLIEDNYIDLATDKINDDFEQLMELTK
ncbi:MAG: AAA family ATPase [Chitinophagaceae bacterium]|nr:AAA family ATPase [Chitinophagaceae bacterium]